MISLSKMKEMRYHPSYSHSLGLWQTTLLGSEFANCHGQGKTLEDAVISLRLVLRIRRKNKSQD